METSNSDKERKKMTVMVEALSLSRWDGRMGGGGGGFVQVQVNFDDGRVDDY